MLRVLDNRKSRSKSPSGRERSRSHSRDTRARSPPKAEHKKKSIKISISESDSESEEDNRRSRDKKSSKKYYESESDDTKRRHKKSSKKRSESDSEESDRHKKKSSSKKYYESDSDDHKHSKKPTRRHDHSESESERRREKSKKSVKKQYNSPSSSEESPGHRHSHAQPKGKYIEGDRRDARYNESDRRDVRYHEDDRHDVRYNETDRRDVRYNEGDRRDVRYNNGYAQPQQYAYAPPGAFVPDPRAMVPMPAPMPDARGNYHDTRHMSYVDTHSPIDHGHSDRPDVHRTHSISSPIGGQYYAQTERRYEYAQPDLTPNARKDDKKDDSGTVYQLQKGGPEYVKTYGKDGKAQLVEVKPEIRGDKRGDRHASIPDKLSTGLSRLAVGGLGVGALTVAGHEKPGERPPGSPLLEAYRGTYQSISPMPFIPRVGNDDELSDLELSESDSESESEHERRPTKKKHRDSDVSITVITPSTARKRVVFYDPEEDAKRIAGALAGTHHAPNTKVLIQVLPALSTDDIFALRNEYKNHAKVPGGQGINLAKHIKMRVPANFGKAVYATALGRWESEAYWANSWYQGGASRRELLIESLMGRSNSDIREIKNCFKDKRYGDDLEKCMKAELKADKFRVAILLALEERRMSDNIPVDIDMVKRDVVSLNKILSSDEGGETAMIQIIVVRSNAHLKEVMRVFEVAYKRNFAREMIGKSRNLVVRIDSRFAILC